MQATITVKPEDFRRLQNQIGDLRRGQLPDLGRPHALAGHRLMLGGRRFNLGHVQLTAQHKARHLIMAWGEIVTAGRSAWTQAEIDSALAAATRLEMLALDYNEAVKRTEAARQTVAQLLTDRVAPIVQQQPTEAVSELASDRPTTTSGQASKTLQQAVDAWRDEMKSRVSTDYHARTKYSLAKMVSVIINRPLADFSKAEIVKLGRYLNNPPLTKKGNPVAKATIVTEANHMRQFLGWCEESELWEGPKFWRKTLTPTFSAEAEDAELSKEADRIDVFSVEELRKLYQAADSTMQTWILCGLNFAWGQKEISTTKERHFKTTTKGGLRVERIRNKKRRSAKAVRGYWLAWQETWDACHEQMSKTPKNLDELAFMHTDGRPLVRATASGRHDAVDTAFEELCVTAGVRRRGFYMLRRTSIDQIDQIAGESIAELHASHAPRGMTQRHYTNRRFGQLRKALRTMRKRLQPLFGR